MSEREEQSRRTARVAGTVVIVGVVVMAFGALGGVGFAKSPASAAQYQYGKITVCHRAGPHGKSVTITIARAALPAHLRHGDTTGPCPRRAEAWTRGQGEGRERRRRRREGSGRAEAEGHARACRTAACAAVPRARRDRPREGRQRQGQRG